MMYCQIVRSETAETAKAAASEAAHAAAAEAAHAAAEVHAAPETAHSEAHISEPAHAETAHAEAAVGRIPGCALHRELDPFLIAGERGGRGRHSRERIAVRESFADAEVLLV